MKKDVFLFRLSFSLFVVSALSIMLSFFGSYKNGNPVEILFAVLTGVLFWGGLAAAILTLIMLNNHRKTQEKKNKTNKKRNNSYTIGIITFFSCKEAMIADIVMIALIILLAVSMFIPWAGQDIKMIVASLLLAAVYAHSMLNGVNYKYIKSLNKRSVE
ncbi:MAG: hypothetical protein UFA98_12030 [Ruminococcus sp.]|nr:hypothetical protein [Ruminococcus sp.]